MDFFYKGIISLEFEYEDLAGFLASSKEGVQGLFI